MKVKRFAGAEHSFGGSSRRKSERVARKTSYSKLTNEPSNPLALDDSDFEDDHVDQSNEMLEAEEEAETALKKGQRFKKMSKRSKMVSVSLKVKGDKARKSTSKEAMEGVDKQSVVKGKKRAQVDEDYDFSVRSQKGASGEFNRIVARCVPGQLCKVIGQLNKKQVQAVKEMGFSKILDLMTSKIPTRLGYFVVDKLDTTRMQIKCRNGAILVDKESIHTLLGLPDSGLDMVGMGEQSEWSDLGVLWRDRYNKKLMSVTDIVLKITSSPDEVGYMFKLDFLVLFFNTMVECQLNSKCKVGVVDFVKDGMDIAKMDWCGYIVSRIRECKKNWRSRVPKCNFQGALTILTLLYVDGCFCNGINEQRSSRPISFWTYEKLLVREELELAKGCFGLGDLRSLYIENDDDGSESAEEFFEVPGVEGYIRKLREKFDLMVAEKTKIEKLLIDAVGQFPENGDIKEMIGIYKMFFKNCGVFEDVEEGEDEPNFEVLSIDDAETPNDKSIFCFNLTEGTKMVRYKGELDPNMTLTQQEIKIFDWAQDVINSNFGSKSKRKDNILESPIPSFSPQLEEGNKVEENVRKRPKRMPNLPVTSKSPCAIRSVNINKKLLKNELKVWCYLTIVEDNPQAIENTSNREHVELDNEFRDKVFETENGYVTKKFLLRSLEADEWILYNVIDCWSAVLNFEERKRSPQSPYRLYMDTGANSTTMLTDKRLDDNGRLGLFKDNLKGVVGGDEKKMRLREFDIVIFPILDSNHYFLICFDLKDPAIEVIDNMAVPSVSIVKDAGRFHNMSTVSKVKDIFVKYLGSVGHIKFRALKACSPVHKYLEWATKENGVDCGVFVMRHMEMYVGSKLENWDCGFKNEGEVQKSQLRDLRIKYAAKILLSDVNIHKKKVANECKHIDVDAEFA